MRRYEAPSRSPAGESSFGVGFCERLREMDAELKRLNAGAHWLKERIRANVVKIMGEKDSWQMGQESGCHCGA